MATPEGKVKTKVKALLNSYEGVYHFWPVQTGYGAAALDCHASFRGKAFYIETKAPGKKPTRRQYSTADEMTDSGAPVFVIGSALVDGEYSGMAALRAWLDTTACLKPLRKGHIYGL